MKLTTEQLKKLIKEEMKNLQELEQVDYDNPRASFGANDQENLEYQQSRNPEGTLDDSTQTVAALRNAIIRELDIRGRYIDRVSGPQIDNLVLQIFELSRSDTEV